jgi:hypothetical protein
MRLRLVPALVIAFYLAMTFFVTYPGYLPFNTIDPKVLGLPFSLFWQVVWISSSMLVLAGLFAWEKRVRRLGRSGTAESE